MPAPTSEGIGTQIHPPARSYMVIKVDGIIDFGPDKKFDTISIRRYHLISNTGAAHYGGVCNSNAQLTLREPHS
jgi:hypothetical protein